MVKLTSRSLEETCPILFSFFEERTKIERLHVSVFGFSIVIRLAQDRPNVWAEVLGFWQLPNFKSLILPHQVHLVVPSKTGWYLFCGFCSFIRRFLQSWHLDDFCARNVFLLAGWSSPQTQQHYPAQHYICLEFEEVCFQKKTERKSTSASPFLHAKFFFKSAK
jgi:hypothetical protein